ncbi:MAG: type I polyketide synthase, partial [Roseiflexaceae bacterium]|nr:type I polyketide synthase [Roseiflexaceae bacterium]
MTPQHAEDLEQLKRALLALKKMRARVDELEKARSESIAIIGIGCRLPGGANSPTAFWQLLHDGVDALSEVSGDRWDAKAFLDADPNAVGKIPTARGGFIRDVGMFDPHFFGISPREAAAMDPQQRMVLEVAWEALEDAGLPPDSLIGSQTGVFIGIGLNDYQRLQVPDQIADPALIDAYTASGNALCITANRLSYTLDLRGPSMAIDTACSSSLVAVLQAVQSLRSGESSLAIVGGSNLILTPATSISVAKFLAPDGSCKFGDARADGYARGEGVVMTVLKPLRRAIADGDPIYAVIRGGALNQDGYSSGLTVPNGVAQQAMLREALRAAGIEPHQIDYIEAHGTGTALGDPIEINALGAVFGATRPVDRPLLVGSVKANIGHLEAGAGLAGLVKVALALRHGAIPRSLHYVTPNPHIPFKQLGVQVVNTHTPWPALDRPARAGVSSFGFGGTNAHIILEAPPTREPAVVVAHSSSLLALSAKSEPALRELAQRYAEMLVKPGAALAEICAAANSGRTHAPHRIAVVAGNPEQMHTQLVALAAGELPTGATRAVVERANRPQVAFLFTGQGAQYVGMGRQLYREEPVFRVALDTCDQLLRSALDRPLLDVIFGQGAEDAQTLIDQTVYTQPALFAIEYALAQLWQSWGIEPAALLGHSVGEYVAACLAGVFSLEDGLRLIAARGRLMQSLPHGGAMAALAIDEQRARQLIAPYTGRVDIAAINEPESCVISGEAKAVDELVALVAAEGRRTRRLSVSHAFHSPLMDPILDAFEREASQVQYAAPRIPLISNLTGQFWAHGAAPDAAYWRRHLRAAVRFADGIATLHGQGIAMFLELGPAPVLAGMASRCLPAGAALLLPSLREGQDEWRQMLGSLAELYTHGRVVNWAAVSGPRPLQHMALPSYPFQREHYWFRQPNRRQFVQNSNTAHPLLGRRVRMPGLSEAIYEAELSADWPQILHEHRVHGTPVFPATGYLELALEAAEATYGPGSYTIDELVID